MFSKINMINYTYHNWGPFLYRTKLPDNILKKLTEKYNQDMINAKKQTAFLSKIYNFKKR